MTIVEHELIEQIETEPAGRSLDWCAELAARLGCREPMTTMRQMWRAGYVTLADPDGAVLADWRTEQVWRAGVPRRDVRVLATDRGSEWVHG